MQSIRLHKRVQKDLVNLDFSTRQRITELFAILASGEHIGMPLSRPMPIIQNGVHELRIKDQWGAYRVFYFLKKRDSILIFHFYKKKTQQMPQQEIETARKRLGEMNDELS